MGHKHNKSIIKDKPNTWVIDIVKTLIANNHILVFMSGRSDKCQLDTRKWLDKYFQGIDYQLYMRPDSQYWEKDAKIKLELYLQHIQPYYDVFCVFDDRKQVVDMWRNALGLNVCQVAEGNF